jgi:hypothetical protein
MRHEYVRGTAEQAAAGAENGTVPRMGPGTKSKGGSPDGQWQEFSSNAMTCAVVLETTGVDQRNQERKAA